LKVTPLIASILLHSGGGPLTGSEVKWFLLVVGTGLLVSICWQLMDDWIKRIRGRKWPTVSAVIDIVSVADATDDARFPSYQATLTYIYQYPEQQMGDYSRSFGDKDEAEAWANSYKGETVKVHVDPRDPTRSVLREEDL
jgi:hypothetical protein